jgi:hypothetical protein
MARNGLGTYSVLNTFVAGTTITASDHNENWSDIGAEITNSVAADGQTAMTGAFKAASGTVDAPGITFGSDTDTGLYRIGANNLGISAGGTNIINVSTTGITITGTLAASGGFGSQITFTAGSLNSDGTVSLPAYSFTSDTDCGVYRIGANNLGIAVNGAKVLDIGTAGLGVTGTLTASSTLTASNGLTVSAGAVTLPATSVAGAALNSDAFATQAQMEAATSNAVAVTPGRAHSHPGVAKAWAYITWSAGTPTLVTSYGVSGITDTAQGKVTVTFSTAMSSANYAVIATPLGGSYCAFSNSLATGSVQIWITDSLSQNLTDPSAVSVLIFGDQ